MANLIDPTESELSGNTNYENLSIYVDMTAKRKGFTVISTDGGGSKSTKDNVVNLMGYKQNKTNPNNNIYTTDYTLVYDNDTNGSYEGFGVKNINIETNASYVPKIIIEFVDIKGMSFFNKKNNSPYSILFDFPPPIFTLKIKGYYGKTLEYKLHLIKQNTKFDGDTGNFIITAEFVGNTFAPLTDILFQNVLLVPKLKDKEVIRSTKGAVNSLSELIIKSKTIKNDVNDKLINSAEYTEYNNLKVKNEKFIENLNKDIDSNLDENSAIVRINKNILIKYDIIIDYTLNKLINELNINPNYEYYIVSYSSGSSNLISDFNKINPIFNKLFEGLKEPINSIESSKSGIDVTHNEVIYNIVVNIKENRTAIIDYVNITNNIRSVNKKNEILNIDINKSFSTLNKEIGNILTSSLGFIPTIKNVIEIITNDIDKYILELTNVYEESIKYINTKKLKSFLNFNDDDNVFPFPDFIKDNKKHVPRNGILFDMPEVSFVDKFIEKFVNYRKDVENSEKKLSSNQIGANNELLWFPINPYDINTYNPYFGLTSIPQIKSVLFARLYIHSFYTYNNKDEFIEYFFLNEVDLITFSITELNLLNAFIVDLKTQKSSSFGNEVLNYDLISVNIKNILSNINISNNEYSGIKFTNNTKITLKKDINLNLRFQNKKFYDDFKIVEIEGDESGLTINNDNNVIFYDGKQNFSYFTSAKLISPGKELEIKEIFKQSIEVTRSDNLSSIIIYNFINKEFKIDDTIYDYYITKNNNNINKSLYGMLNLLYVPNLKIIETLLFKFSLITELPVFVKLYISSLVYAINNPDEYILDVDPEYLSAEDKEVIDKEKNDFIYDIYKNKNIINFANSNFTYYRSVIIDKLKNLSDSDKKTYIDYYIRFTEDENFINEFKKFIEDVRSKEKVSDINFDLLPKILFSKGVIINNSTLSYNNKGDFNALFEEGTIKKNYKTLSFATSPVLGETPLLGVFPLLPSTTKTFNGLYSTFVNNLITKLDSKRKSSDSNSTDETKNIQEHRIETYYSFKHFVDRWFYKDNNGELNFDTIFGSSESKLFNSFSFVDRTYNSNSAEKAIIDISILQEFENDYNVNMLTVIGKLLNENGFEFYPIQNFIDFKNNNSWDANEIFKTYTSNVSKSNSSPRFTCIYVGGTSKYLDSPYNESTSFKNDGITDVETAEDFNDADNGAFGFRVRFGDGKQSIFTKIDISTEEFQPTNESLKSMSLIMDGGDNTPIPIAQNLFSTYEQRSYVCKITMMGNMMIQPTQYFMLENIPMYRGLYLITKVSHVIDENNTMLTSFEGIRVPKQPRPFITEPLSIYAKDLIGSDLDFSTGGISISETNTNYEKKDRTIYIVAGHDDKDSGATARVGEAEIKESDLTKEFRDLLVTETARLNIKTAIDNNKFTINQVINDLNKVVKEDDYIIDIHFNSFKDESAKGTEIFIKDPSVPNLLEVAKGIIKVISDNIPTNIRPGGSGLPAGIKLQEDTAVKKLGIFNDIPKTKNILLIEICFISNADEYRNYASNKKLIAQEIAKVLQNISITDNEKKLASLTTFDILNTLKYDKINERNEPIPDINTFNRLVNYSDFTLKYTGDSPTFSKKVPYIANNLISAFTDSNNSLFKALLRSQIALTGNKYNIDPLFLSGLIYVESKFIPVSISRTGAFGIGQFTINNAMLEVLRKLDDNKNTKTDIYKFINDEFNFTETTYGEILNILFGNQPLLNVIDFNQENLLNQLKNNKYFDIFINNVFDNPFIMIELVGIYLKELETEYVGTSNNKNLGILALSYNTGNFNNSRSTIKDKPYFSHLVNYYNFVDNNRTSNNIVIGKKLLGNVYGEGILYSEKLITEYLIKFIPDINLDKSNIINV